MDGLGTVMTLPQFALRALRIRTEKNGTLELELRLPWDPLVDSWEMMSNCQKFDLHLVTTSGEIWSGRPAYSERWTACSITDDADGQYLLNSFMPSTSWKYLSDRGMDTD